VPVVEASDIPTKESTIPMKSFLAVAVLTITAIPIAFAQTTDSGKKQSGSVEQTLMNAEQEIVDAVVKGDTSVLEKYLADDTIFTDPGGMVMDKAQFIADLKAGNLKLESSKLDDMKVHVHGNAAVVTYGTTDKGAYKGKDTSGNYRWTDVFVKRKGSWQLVAGQGTRVAQQ
jgi:ketosteroid isomerase-like protein